MAAPTFTFNVPNALNVVEDDLNEERDDYAALFVMAWMCWLNVPPLGAGGQSVTSSPAAKPTTITGLNLPDGRQMRIRLSYTGDLVTRVETDIDQGSGWELYSDMTITYDGAGNFTGAST